VIALEQAPQQILAALQEKNLQQDNRAELGKKYGGRQVAYDLIQKIEKQ
jgi:malonate decarboxylase gamma subunit